MDEPSNHGFVTEVSYGMSFSSRHTCHMTTLLGIDELTCPYTYTSGTDESYIIDNFDGGDTLYILDSKVTSSWDSESGEYSCMPLELHLLYKRERNMEIDNPVIFKLFTAMVDYVKSIDENPMQIYLGWIIVTRRLTDSDYE